MRLRWDVREYTLEESVEMYEDFLRILEEVFIKLSDGEEI